MEEYTQITLNDWMQIKEDIRRKLKETAENFIYIGYRLKQIAETESYKQDGAVNIYEFAEKEYGLTRSVTSRFMAINTKFSVDGNSMELQEQYKEFGSSKLTEMLTLSDEDCRLITEKTTVKEIRALKEFNRQQGTTSEPAELSGLQKCIIDYFSRPEKREILNAILKLHIEGDLTEGVLRQQAEIINPSEFDTHVKGIVYLFLYEYDRGVAYKTITTNVTNRITWAEFIEEIVRIYEACYGPDTWENFYGPAEIVPPATEPEKEQPKETEKPINTKSEHCATSHKNEPPKAEEMTEKEQVTVAESYEEPEESEPNIEEMVPASDENIIMNPYRQLHRRAEDCLVKITDIMNEGKELMIPFERLEEAIEKTKILQAALEEMKELEVS